MVVGVLEEEAVFARVVMAGYRVPAMRRRRPQRLLWSGRWEGEGPGRAHRTRRFRIRGIRLRHLLAPDAARRMMGLQSRRRLQTPILCRVYERTAESIWVAWVWRHLRHLSLRDRGIREPKRLDPPYFDKSAMSSRRHRQRLHSFHHVALNWS